MFIKKTIPCQAPGLKNQQNAIDLSLLPYIQKGSTITWNGLGLNSGLDWNIFLYGIVLNA